MVCESYVNVGYCLLTSYMMYTYSLLLFFQTNVYLSAQKKKIRPFEGFNRRAIVCIPTQEDLKKRTEDRKKEGIELPENAVSDMKSKGQVICNLFLSIRQHSMY